jgi:hypothetical protein
MPREEGDVTGQFPFAPALTSIDNDNHAPGSQRNWQESTLVALVDPVRGLAGFHRIGIHPNRGTASLYSWTQVDGKIVSDAKRTGLAIPAGALTGSSLEGVSFHTTDPLRACRVSVDRDGVKSDLLFESFTGPVQMNMDVAGATIGAGHYDSLGKVTGHIEEGGRSHAFEGVGFLDHSWGARDGGSILAHRWIMAVLDGANHINVFPTWGPKGRMMLGYMLLDGTFSYVADVRSELHVADDPLCLDGVHAVITDRLGRTVEIHGRGAGEYSVQPYGQGYFCAHKPMIYECRGRVWTGMVEFSSMRFIPPWHRERLGISKDNEWLKWDGEQP